MELPVDIMLDILTRLPTESVLESKLVSKPWRDVVRHPSFSQKNFNRLLSVDDDSGNLGFILSDHTDWKSRQLYYVDYDDNSETPISVTRRINLPHEWYTFQVFDSCNGLVCLYNYSSIIICNPITKEYVHLPYLKHCLGFGFGYLVSTNDYKIVSINKLEDEVVEVKVYTLGSGNGWRNVGKLNAEFKSLDATLGVHANGALYWMFKEKRKIAAFHLPDEKFREVSVPPVPRRPCWNQLMKQLRLVRSLGDHLLCADFIICFDDTGVQRDWSYDTWLLKGNCIHDMSGEVDYESMSWSKEFNIGDKEPFSITNGGAVLCFKGSYTNPTVYRYDAKSSSVEMIFSFKKKVIPKPSAQ